MDVFARVCEALVRTTYRPDSGAGLESHHTAQFSTWLVTVVRNLTIDWFRQRSGRHRLSSIAAELPPLRRQLFELVFLQHRSHIEAYESLQASTTPALTFRGFLVELRATYRAVTDGRRGRILREFGPLPPDPAALESEDSLPALQERRRILERVMASLDPEDQVAVRLYVIDELPAADIARITGLPNAKAVYNRVYRALAAVRRPSWRRTESAGRTLEHLGRGRPSNDRKRNAPSNPGGRIRVTGSDRLDPLDRQLAPLLASGEASGPPTPECLDDEVISALAEARLSPGSESRRWCTWPPAHAAGLLSRRSP